MDFTLKIYEKLLRAIIDGGYAALPFRDYLKGHEGKTIILRNDVDARVGNSSVFADILKKNNLKATFYFRVLPGLFDQKIIEKIAVQGHEIGYHYEDMELAYRQQKSKYRSEKSFTSDELAGVAIGLFAKHLEQFRRIVPVETICMHGSPTFRFDNRILWEKYSYRDFGLAGEPYFDINFQEVAYFSDTGRRWNGTKYSVRDKVNSNFEYSFTTTRELIHAIPALPESMMLTFHPQRWNENLLPWVNELVSQSVKNQVKRYLYVKKSINAVLI
jgi:hypothetical protein